MPHIADGIVESLRSKVMLDEVDLLDPVLPDACSSLDDGPFCPALGRLRSGPGSAHAVVDRLLSERVRRRNQEAFDWSTDTFRSFSNLVSRVVIDGFGNDIGKSSKRQRDGRGLPVLTPDPAASARSASQCFQLALWKLPPHEAMLPRDFSAGLPAEVAASWEGGWEVTAGPSRRRERGRDAEPAWATRINLRTALGYLRFSRPVVLRRVLLQIPSDDDLEGELPWAFGAMVCGRRAGEEQWCTPVDEAVRRRPEGSLLVNVGNSIFAVDELAFIGSPRDGLQVALMEVLTTPSSHRLYDATPQSRRVVLLQRPGAAMMFQPSLTSVSRDAAVWDMNQVLWQNMRTRRLDGRLARAHTATAAALEASANPFKDVLVDLRSGVLALPAGLSLVKVQKEVKTLLALLDVLEDKDMLAKTGLDSVLQEKVRAKGLDSLLALQAAWYRSGGAARRKAADADADDLAAEADEESDKDSWLDRALREVAEAKERMEERRRTAEEEKRASREKRPRIQEIKLDFSKLDLSKLSGSGAQIELNRDSLQAALGKTAEIVRASRRVVELSEMLSELSDDDDDDEDGEKEVLSRILRQIGDLVSGDDDSERPAAAVEDEIGEQAAPSEEGGEATDDDDGEEASLDSAAAAATDAGRSDGGHAPPERRADAAGAASSDDDESSVFFSTAPEANGWDMSKLESAIAEAMKKADGGSDSTASGELEVHVFRPENLESGVQGMLRSMMAANGQEQEDELPEGVQELLQGMLEATLRGEGGEALEFDLESLADGKSQSDEK